MKKVTHTDRFGDADRGLFGNPRAIRAGFLLDGQGGGIQKDRLVAISKGCIEDIKPYAPEAVLTDDMVDMSDATVIPLLMDAHVHLAFSGTLDPVRREKQIGCSVETAFEAVSRHLQASLENGVGAVRDAGDRHGAVLQYKARCRLPVHLSATCWAWHALGRYGGMIGKAPRDRQTLADAVGRSPGAIDHIKIINSGINSLRRFGHETSPQFSEAQLAQVCRQAHGGALPVMVHANGREAVRASVDAGCSSIEHGYFMGKGNLCRMVDVGIAWVPTLIPMNALAHVEGLSMDQKDTARRTLDHQLAQVRQAQALGVKVALGTDAGSMGVNHGVAVHQELALLIEAGIPVSAAIQCATLNVARLIGLDGCGALRRGWRADFIVVPGRPEDLPGSLNNIKAVCQGGQWLRQSRV